MQYVIDVECYTDFMEKLCDGFIRISIGAANRQLALKGKTKTCITLKKI